jgi:hypothetical protein
MMHSFLVLDVNRNLLPSFSVLQTRVSCGALSGLMAVNVVYPFDVVRRRMQMHEGEKGLYRTPFHAISQIVREVFRTPDPKPCTDCPRGISHHPLLPAHVSTMMASLSFSL